MDINNVPTKDRYFHHVSQLRSGKQLAVNQSLLITASNDINMTKFNGQLEVTKAGTAELDKEKILRRLRRTSNCLAYIYGTIFQDQMEPCSICVMITMHSILKR